MPVSRTIKHSKQVTRLDFAFFCMWSRGIFVAFLNFLCGTWINTQSRNFVAAQASSHYELIHRRIPKGVSHLFHFDQENEKVLNFLICCRHVTGYVWRHGVQKPFDDHAKYVCIASVQITPFALITAKILLSRAVSTFGSCQASATEAAN